MNFLLLNEFAYDKWILYNRCFLNKSERVSVLLLTKNEKEILSGLKTEIESRNGKTVLFAVVNYKKIEVAEDSGADVTYLDPDSSTELSSLEELQAFVRNSQRWSFERFLDDEHCDVESFSWDSCSEDDYYDEYFDKFAVERLGFYKTYSELHAYEVATFLTRKEAEKYIVEQSNHLHENAFVEEKSLPMESETARLLSLLYRMAESPEAA